jgi:crossover junction endodeoxyribonuclease RuvC
VRVLGVDPGTVHMGVGMVDLAGDEVTHIASTTISPKARQPLSDRLAVIFEKLEKLMAEWTPDTVAIEQPFAGKNVRSALAVGQAQAVAMVVAARRGLDVATYSPSQVKQAVTDHGGSSKEQVREMVQIVLQLEEPPETSDAADALAVALCHVNATRADRLVIME